MKKVLLVGLILIFSPLVALDKKLVFNITHSMPLGLYIKTDSNIDIGSLVSFCVEDEWAELSLERGYLEKGICDNGTIPLLKEVVALAGDTSPMLPTKKQDSSQRSIPTVHVSSIPTGYAFVQGNDEWSFDSRYFGPVALDRLTAVKPFLTFN